MAVYLRRFCHSDFRNKCWSRLISSVACCSKFNNPMRMDSLEAVAQATVGNPVLKEILDKLGDTRPNVFEVNC